MPKFILKNHFGAFLSLFFFIATPFLHASKSSPPRFKFGIRDAGHWFYTNYNLYIPQSTSVLPVEMVAGSDGTSFTKNQPPNACPGLVRVSWNFKVKKAKKKVGVFSTDEKISNLEQSITHEWHPLFQYLANKIAHPYFLLDKGEKPIPNNRDFAFKSTTSTIVPLPACKLETLDQIYVSPRVLSLANGVLVRVCTQEQNDKKGKKRLICTASFCTKRNKKNRFLRYNLFKQKMV